MTTIPQIQHPWIHAGYSLFAHEGPQGLKVERLARMVGKNKSSFYHHFADLEVFTQVLLNYHLEQAAVMAEKEQQCKDLQGLIDIIVEHKIDLLFNRQLRVHRENPDFERCFQKTTEMVVHSLVPVWASIIGLTENSYLAQLVLKLSMDNFYLQITDETLNTMWLNTYFEELRHMVQVFKQMGTQTPVDDPSAMVGE